MSGLAGMPELAWWQWTLGVLCAWQVGVAKSGMPGFGVLVAPLMILLVGDARLSAGWLLPVMCVADVFAVITWRRHPAVRRLAALAPSVMVGMAAGAAALALPERVLRRMIGVILVAMLAAHIRRRLRPDAPAGHSMPYGFAAGFSTTVANAAGPVMNLYLLSKRLSKEEFVATGAWFFFVVNLAKTPIYVWHGLFSRQSLVFDAMMVPAVLAGALTGRWMVGWIPQRIFENVVLVLTAASTVLLFL